MEKRWGKYHKVPKSAANCQKIGESGLETASQSPKMPKNAANVRKPSWLPVALIEYG